MNKEDLVTQANTVLKLLASAELTPDEVVKVLCYALCVQNELR